VTAGSVSSAAAAYLPPAEEEANYVEAAQAIADAGVDALFLEMMHNTHTMHREVLSLQSASMNDIFFHLVGSLCVIALNSDKKFI
jgi:hypothetical protein